jgi:hypothetical protein
LPVVAEAVEVELAAAALEPAELGAELGVAGTVPVLAEVPVEGLETWGLEITTAMVLAMAQATAASDPKMAPDLVRATNLDGGRTPRDFWELTI